MATITKAEKELLREWVERGDVAYCLHRDNGLPQNVIDIILEIINSKLV